MKLLCPNDARALRQIAAREEELVREMAALARQRLAIIEAAQRLHIAPGVEHGPVSPVGYDNLQHAIYVATNGQHGALITNTNLRSRARRIGGL